VIERLRACGGEIVGVFDKLTELHGFAAAGQVIRPLREVSTAASQLAPSAVFVFLNDPAVQEALDQLTAAGARLVLNCTPLPLRVPGNVSLRDVDLCSHLLLGMSRALETPRQRRRRVRPKS
jgi:NADH/NAD ratio-sensing transcriptional regulator Rex